MDAPAGADREGQLAGHEPRAAAEVSDPLAGPGVEGAEGGDARGGDVGGGVERLDPERGRLVEGHAARHASASRAGACLAGQTTLIACY